VTFQDAARTVSVLDHTGHREFLEALYTAAKTHLGSYSYLKFAADLGFSATNVLRLVIAGERPLSSKAARRIAKALGLQGDSLRYWTALVAYAEATTPVERDRLLRLLVRHKTKARPAALDDAQAEYYAQWHHPVVREMIALPGFDGSPEWIQDRLAFPLRLDAVRKSLLLLERLGVLTLDRATGRYDCASACASFATPREVDAIEVIKYHQAMIALGAEAITRIDEDVRDIRAVTVSLPLSAVPLLKAKVDEWTREILALEASSARGAEPSEVFQVNVQVFPFTRNGGAK